MISIIPKVKKIIFNKKTGIFNFPKNKTFSFENEAAFISDTTFQINLFLNEFQYIETDKKNSFIHFSYDKKIKNNAYKIKFNKFIKVKASSNSGFVSALSTLTQIFLQTNKSYCFTINDEPKYSWRGILFDPCRHFFGLKKVENLLFYSFLYKINKFHMHLNDDQGWRIEIKRLPLLTKIGSKRTNQDGSRESGFFSHEDIKKIIKISNMYNIEVIPEIDLPGHTRAATFAYPNLLCHGSKKSKIVEEWGVFNEVLCMSNHKSYEFASYVIKEIIELFPSKNIHIGGDECPNMNWKNCKNCQSKMKKDNLKTEYQLQTKFINYINNILIQNNKKAIAWDDLFEYDFPLQDNFIYALWRNWKINDYNEVFSKIKRRKNINIIFNSNSHTYFDHGYSEEYNKNNNIPKGWVNSLENSFNFDPIKLANKLNSTNVEISDMIIGSECSLWSERFKTFNELTERLFPRLFAFSDKLWGSDDNYCKFLIRCEAHKKIMKKLNTKIAFFNNKNKQ